MQLPSEPRTPIVFFVNGIGDHMLNLPALRALRRRFGSKLKLVCFQGMYGIFLEELDLERLEIRCETRDGQRQFEVAPVAEFCRGCDLFISLNPWHSVSVDALLAALGPIPTIGLFPAFATALQRDYSKHTSRLAFDVVQCFEPSWDVLDFAGQPRLPRKSELAAARILEGSPPGARYLAVHCDTAEEKMLPSHVWDEVVCAFLRRHQEFHVLLVGSRATVDRWSACEERIIPCYGLQLATSLALVARADLFVGIDSSLLHAADFHRIPSVGVFLSTNPDEFGLLLAPHWHVVVAPEFVDSAAKEIGAALEELCHGAVAKDRPSASAVLAGGTP